MKTNRILLTLIGLCTMLIIQAQVPEKIDFQAMARDASGNPYVNQPIGVQISIRQGSSTGTIVYQEEHSTTTDDYGLFVLPIGEGTPVSGTFAAIDWTGGSYYTQVEIDPDGGINYTDMGTMEMMSVPFALFANRAEYGEDADADPANELQTISESGNVITLSNGGGSVTDNTEDADADPTNEVQTLSESGNVITLSDVGGTGGGTVIDNIDDADADPSNELQNLSVSGNNLSISSGNSVTLPSSAWGQSGNKIYYNSGNVGIGTTNPVEKLHVVGNIITKGNQPTLRLIDTDGIGTKPMISFENSDLLAIHGEDDGDEFVGIYSAFSPNRTNDAIFRVYGSSVGTWGNRIEIKHDGTNGIITTDVGDLILDPEMNVGIGTSSPNRLLHLKQKTFNKAIRIEHQSTSDYWETGIGTNSKNYKFIYNDVFKADIDDVDGAYIQGSDRRLKKNIEYMGSVLSKIVQLKPSTYNYIDNVQGAPRSTGFVAQEVEEVFPELVRETDDGYKGLVYDGFAVISIKAIQELNDKMIQMQLEIDDLKQAIKDK